MVDGVGPFDTVALGALVEREVLNGEEVDETWVLLVRAVELEAEESEVCAVEIEARELDEEDKVCELD